MKPVKFKTSFIPHVPQSSKLITVCRFCRDVLVGLYVVIFFIFEGIQSGRCEDNPEVLREKNPLLEENYDQDVPTSSIDSQPLLESVSDDTMKKEDAVEILLNAVDPNLSSSEGQQDQSILLKRQERMDVLDFKDIDIVDALKLMTSKSGINIVPEDNVQGRINLYLQDIDFKDALKIIVDTNDLAYFEDVGVIRVMTVRDFETKFGHSFSEDIQTSIIKLVNSQVADLNNILIQIKKEGGKVLTDEKFNTVILMNSAQKLSAMKKLIKDVDVPWKTETFTLSHGKAEEMAAKVNEVLTANLGKLKFDSRSNRLVVTDTAQKIEEIRKMIYDLDQKESEILIEAKIMQIVLSDEHKMGVDWEAIVSDYRSLNFKNNLSALGGENKNGKLSIGTLSQEDYAVLLEALDAVGKTNILSAPRITTLTNQETKIFVGSTVPYETKTTTRTSSPRKTVENVNFVEVGVKLFLTAMVHPDDFLSMKINPEVSAVSRKASLSDNNSTPSVETFEAETSVMVKDGITIVVGGLLRDEKIESIKKIPVLGDLPWVGFAFRNEDQLIRKTELVIFLTPKIIKENTQ